MMLPDIVFKNRLAARLFGYFLVLAFLPILGFGYFSLWQTNMQMERSHNQYLLKTTEMFNQLYLSRLLQIRDKLIQLAEEHAALQPTLMSRPVEDRPIQGDFFSKITVLPVATHGIVDHELRHLQSGKVLLQVRASDGPFQALSMIALLPGGMLVLEGTVRPEALWGIPEELPLPIDTDLRIVTLSGGSRTLFASDGDTHLLEGETLDAILGQSQGITTLQSDSQSIVCYFRELFLASHFSFPRWTLVLIQNNSAAASSQSMTMALFPLLVGLCLSLVLYLILVFIRRTLTPLSQLQAMTQRISEQDFDARAEIRSGDEIEELGHAFNSMARQLKQQFLALQSQAAIDREILSAIDVDSVVTGALDYTASVFPGIPATLFLWDRGVFRVFGRGQDKKTKVTTLPMSKDVVDGFWECLRDAGWVAAGIYPAIYEQCRGLFSSAGLVCSVPLHGQPVGFIALGLWNYTEADRLKLELVGRTLNQIAVAYGHIRLLRELEEFNWGTLEALARAVDEKSPWTQGHSNRVAALAIDLAEQMGWPEDELDLLHRAALLHDLGKIGIATGILDKPGRLDAEEFAVIMTHPDRGAKILEPVRAYSNVIPMVRHHHERFNGSGYPSALVGEAIPLGARILAVVDVYDALSTSRPYREGWSHARTCSYLEENAGILFDPEVVRVFLSMK